MTLDESVIRAPFAEPVRGLCTTRFGGVGHRPFDSLNLGTACGDDPADVEANRLRLERLLPTPPCWLRQVHGSCVTHLADWAEGIEADAAWTDRPGQVACVLAADCLPILVAERTGGCIAAIHAGWRGLAAGVIARTIAELPADPTRLQAWIGPRICRHHYEVGAEVRAAFDESEAAFEPVRPGHWLADLPRIAERQLREAGARQVTDSGACTAEGSRFFSYRRDKRTGRMAACIWLQSRTA
ncbi:MAG: peptidoglycan editing factor PgeF [Wenzhouxiangellaceae bacterium]